MIYREFTALLWWSVALAVTGITLFVVAATASYPQAVLGLYGLAAFVCLFAGWFVVGIYRMNRIVLTTDVLVVGRERFRRGDIDAIFGVQPPLLLDPRQQLAVEHPIPLPAGGDIRIVGGSWGRRVGTAMVLLRDANDGQLLAVFSRHPDQLDTHLTEWLTHIPDTPEDLDDGTVSP